jgi:hypothetical protein
MSRIVSISSLLGAITSIAAGQPADLMRFTNGDQLHGSFEGIKEGPQAMWQRDDVSAPVDFKTADIRHIVLQGGRASKGLTSLSHIALVNGDRIPGTVVALDEGVVIMQTGFAGVLKIPRNQVAMLAPSPLGGRIHYHGPFVEDEWDMAHASFPDGFPQASGKEENAGMEPPARWRFSGSAWYWQNKLSGTALVRKDVMPERAILRFDLAWKNRLSVAIGFDADFARPKSIPDPEGDDEDGPKRQIRFVPGDSTALPLLFGNSYVLHIFASHLMLYRTSVNGEGVASVDRVQVNSNSIRLGDSGEATLEIRSNRRTGQISLFVDGEFAAQWSEGGDEGALVAGRAGNSQKPSGFGFVVQSENSSVRISDIMVAEWNGMPDSARSLQVDDQDIVLLSNGTDRFSGTVNSMNDGKIDLSAKYGKFQFPLNEVAEIRFARKRLAKEIPASEGNLIVRFSPLGQVSGRPLSGGTNNIRLLNSVAGEIDLNLESAVMLDFKPSTNIIDDWNSEF